MKILSGYIAKIYLKFWLLSLSAMILLVIVANLFGGIDRAFSSVSNFLAFIDDILASLPITLDIALPLTVVLATLLTFNSLGRTSELVAMRAAGMGIFHQMRPILVVLVFISALDYYNQNYLYPLLADQEKLQSVKSRQRNWVALDDRLYYVPTVGAKDGRLSEVRIFQWAKQPFRLLKIQHVSKISLTDDDRLLFENILDRKASEKGWRFSQRLREKRENKNFLQWFQEEIPEAHYMPIFELYRKIRQLESKGAPVELYVLEWYQKTAAMVAPFVLVWFGMPLSQAFFRKGQASGEIIIGLLGGLLFLVATEIFFTLGQGGFLPPLLAAWASNIIYFLIGGALLLRVR